MRILIASAVLLSFVPALAQDQPRFDPRKGYAYGRPARDGCVNIPGVAHNSADCSRIPPQDASRIMNTPSTDLSGKPTGATENHERNIRILSGKSDN